jgi:hypothetical protein
MARSLQVATDTVVLAAAAASGEVAVDHICSGIGGILKVIGPSFQWFMEPEP